MSLCRLVYLSEAVGKPTAVELENLVQKCHVKNSALGVSGLLLYSGGNFMQVLEGDDLCIASIYAKIEKDVRHKNLRRLLFKSADRRLFPDWGMNLALTDRAIAIDRTAVDKTLLGLRLLKDNSESFETQALTLLQEFRRQLMTQAA
jgi:hypothetical protein